MERNATIYEIAQKTGLSPSTVNRALRGERKVKESTRALVCRTAQEMGYKQNRVASSLSRMPVKISAVLYSSIAGFSNEVEKGIKRSFQ